MLKSAPRPFPCWCVTGSRLSQIRFRQEKDEGLNNKPILADYPALLEKAKANDTLIAYERAFLCQLNCLVRGR